MKRSEINAAIKWSIELLDKNNFKLPRFAYWTMDEWEKNKDKIILLASHDLDDLNLLCDEIYFIENGRIKDSSVEISND